MTRHLSSSLCYDKMSNTLTPFVYWAQTENQITLKVDLTDVKVQPYQIPYIKLIIWYIHWIYLREKKPIFFNFINIIFLSLSKNTCKNHCNLFMLYLFQDFNVDLNETTLQVTAYGQGARGLNNYSFNLNLHSPIDPNVMTSL